MRKLVISVPSDLTEIKTKLTEKGHQVIDSGELNKETSVFIFGGVEEEWEEINSLEWMDFGDNKYVMTINADKLSQDEIFDAIDRIAAKKLEGEVVPSRIKVEVDESLTEIKDLLLENGYDVIPSHKVDPDVAAIVFSGVDEAWEEIFTYQMRQYGANKYVLTVNATTMQPTEILEVISRLCIKK